MADAMPWNTTWESDGVDPSSQYTPPPRKPDKLATSEQFLIVGEDAPVHDMAPPNQVSGVPFVIVKPSTTVPGPSPV